jgi:hypothetical protein
MAFRETVVCILRLRAKGSPEVLLAWDGIVCDATGISALPLLYLEIDGVNILTTCFAEQ